MRPNLKGYVMKMMTIKEFSSRLGVTPGTVRKWEDSGRIKPVRTNGGHRRYTEADIRAVMRRKTNSGGSYEKRNVIYCRVSEPEQKDELIRQAEKMQMFALGRGLEAEVIAEIGAGGNMLRPKLSALISDVINGKVDKILVLHKSRLMHAGFELFENIARECDCEIIAVTR